MENNRVLIFIFLLIFALASIRPRIAYEARKTFCKKSYFKRINIGFLSHFYTDVRTGEKRDNTIFLRVFVFEVINDFLTLGTVAGLAALHVLQKNADTLSLNGGAKRR